MVTEPELHPLLRAAGLRVTRPRVAVLQAVHAAPHADTTELLHRTRQTLPEVSQQAVYDVLAALTDAGLVRRLHAGGSVARYEARVDDNHHHLLCRSCGTIVDVDCAVGPAPCLAPDDAHGFTVEQAEVVYRGLCASCSSAPDPVTT
ncbi:MULTISPECIES: Fur family transcriptional regulator [Desertihabitans]|uniref:Transcriptional repressor n=1 Tax=Desertihabitans brevis TaxID=2268447 RepID=A0A367YYM7_9ACTN|nr:MULTISPECIES: Fur family transcriptional regulator [Desertihabitans]RCK70619.1 transcriptional repressor [Desertihabitans brevis]